MANNDNKTRLDKENLGKNLRKLRYENNETYEEFAGEIGVSSRLIYDYESGIKFPSLDTLIRIVCKFNVSLDSLLS